MKLALVVLISVLVLLPATASAQLGQMPIYRLSPASGSTLSLLPAYGATRVVFQSAPTSYFDMITGITFEVASQNVMGRDGTLSDDFNVDYDYIHAGDTDPSVYVTAFRNFNFQGHTPGTYYFQFSAYTYVTHQHLASPVFWFVWDPTAGATGGGAPEYLGRHSEHLDVARERRLLLALHGPSQDPPFAREPAHKLRPRHEVVAQMPNALSRRK